MKTLFGTDGVRGIANIEPMTAETVLEIGRATAHICRRHEGRHRILIGKDTRLSGYMIENALTAGICSMGVDVLLVGPVPTPGIAFITRSMRADAGIVISASHNPYHDNGIKIFSRDGFKLPESDESEIEALVSTGQIADIRPTAEAVGKAHRIDDALGRYIEFCKRSFPADLTLDGLTVVLDCANGATYKVAPIIFSELGADVTALHVSPDGTNINEQCGSQHTDDLVRTVRERKADIGLAFDGDGDRLIAVDETGRELTGDHILVICAEALKASGALRNDLVVITPMTNLGARMAFRDLGISCMEAPVGDRNVLERMRTHDAVLGGEQSGHIIFLDRHTTGDGIISALQLLAVMCQTGKRASDLANRVAIAPQRLINLEVAAKPSVESMPTVREAVRAAEAELGAKGRVLVRYSGTQQICRVMVEGPTETDTDRIAAQIANAVRHEIGR